MKTTTKNNDKKSKIRKRPDGQTYGQKKKWNYVVMEEIRWWRRKLMWQSVGNKKDQSKIEAETKRRDGRILCIY